MRRSRLALGVIALLLVETAWMLYPRARALVLQYRQSPAAHGREIARSLGCFGCHGPDGRGGVPNPGSRWETVPGFGEQTLMMFVSGDAELREYILDGAPARKRADSAYRAQIEAQALRMPAFRGWVSDDQVDALVAYLRSVSGMLTPPDGPAARGVTLARKYGCLSCHGEMGMGGQKNPGSLKGYIPGFFGEDFSELVRSDEELLAWIRDGKTPRLANDSIARYFLDRQRIKMPEFKSFLSEEEVHDLAAYVRWLSEGSWRERPLH